MAKSSGLGDNLYIEGVDVSGDVGSLDSISSPQTLLDMTDITQSAIDRLYGVGDGMISFTSWFNDLGASNRAGATDSSFLALSELPTGEVDLMYCRGTVIGNPLCNFTDHRQINYDATRGNDGAIAFSVESKASGGVSVEWGVQLTAGKITVASASEQVGVVDSAQTTKGARFYIQTFSISSGTPTCVIEDSADTTNGVDGIWGTVKSMAHDCTATGASRETVTGTVEKGVRATFSGTFSNLVAAVGFQRGTAEDREDLS